MPNVCISKDNSAASHHYWREEDKIVLNNIIKINGPSVEMPNNAPLQSKQQGQVPLSAELSEAEKNAMILQGLTSASLISLR